MCISKLRGNMHMLENAVSKWVCSMFKLDRVKQPLLLFHVTEMFKGKKEIRPNLKLIQLRSDFVYGQKVCSPTHIAYYKINVEDNILFL